MIATRLKYCVYDPDPRGNVRYYLRKKGYPKIRIDETFDDGNGNITEAFMKAYLAAIASLSEAAPKKPPPKEDTFDWLVDQYIRSEKFQKFDAATQRDKRSVLKRFCETAGPLPYKKYRRQDMEASQLKRRDTPGAADKLVKVIRALFNWAISKGYATINPATGIEKINKGSQGFHTWTAEEVEQYKAFHKIGTKPRLALEIMLNVGARISDTAVLGRQNESGGWLKFTAKKNRNKSPVTIEVPIRPDLRAALAATKTGDMTYLVTDYGQAFTVDGLGNRMREWCDDAGLPHCTSHGLRKASAVTLAENGASASELCAIFGWTKLETAEIYIRRAQKKKMAGNAFARLDDYRDRKSVSSNGPKTPHETK
ncbi:integrase [Neorhizobium sp. SOG26]|uniref:tyrosine-type recombinase/integrase n=1 Tax=Neorhizobium sp. SOG26 TaxID=2060726 RepID=UPI000E570AED|nr:tyrosine-type recombinase/integrase [Neorhizobium sp. SOG26]AXV15819.1 integrase [Neorhizobium sp. SOG26]